MKFYGKIFYEVLWQNLLSWASLHLSQRLKRKKNRKKKPSDAKKTTEDGAEKSSSDGEEDSGESDTEPAAGTETAKTAAKETPSKTGAAIDLPGGHDPLEKKIKEPLVIFFK